MRIDNEPHMRTEAGIHIKHSLFIGDKGGIPDNFFPLGRFFRPISSFDHLNDRMGNRNPCGIQDYGDYAIARTRRSETANLEDIFMLAGSAGNVFPTTEQACDRQT